MTTRLTNRPGHIVKQYSEPRHRIEFEIHKVDGRKQPFTIWGLDMSSPEKKWVTHIFTSDLKSAEAWVENWRKTRGLAP
jgi:hypothetical protein